MRRDWFPWRVAVIGAVLGLASCGPDLNPVANRLREQTLRQDREIADLKDKLALRETALKQSQEELDRRLPRVETLPETRLADLFTAAKIEIRPQTDSWDMGTGKGLTGFRVFFRTLTEDGSNIPLTGRVTIEAFELAAAPADPRRLGTWTFSPAEMKKNWYGGLGLNQFACNCPWEKPPNGADVAFRLSFRDALTGRVIEAHLDKKVTLPGKSADK